MSSDRRRIIVGVSGSIGSLQALREAVGQARTCGGDVHAVMAWTPPSGEVVNPGAALPPLLDLWADEAFRRLRKAFDEALGGPPDDVPVLLHVVRGHPGSVLVRLADRPDDLIVVATGTGGRLHRALWGSVSRYCVSHAPCRVLVVPPPELLRQCRRGWRRTPRARMGHLVPPLG